MAKTEKALKEKIAAATKDGLVKVRALKECTNNGRMNIQPGEVFDMALQLVEPHVTAGVVEIAD